MEPLFAYLDPGTGSLVLQAMVAGFAGLAVAGKYGWRWLFRRILHKTLTAVPHAGVAQIATVSVGEATDSAVVASPPDPILVS